jgi:hypothetical protein
MMKGWTIFTHSELYPPPTYTARLTVRSGTPGPEHGMIPLSPGVDRKEPVVVIGQDSGDFRTRQGNQLQAIKPEHARELARVLLEAADFAEQRGGEAGRKP